MKPSRIVRPYFPFILFVFFLAVGVFASQDDGKYLKTGNQPKKNNCVIVFFKFGVRTCSLTLLVKYNSDIEGWASGGWAFS